MLFFRKIITNAKLLWHSLFRGMAAADTIINAPTGSNNSTEIVQQQRTGGVMDDLLEQKETQRVIETRDKYYRVLKEADKWDTSSIKIIGEDENGLIFGGTDGLKKKSKLDFMKHPPVYNEENLPLRTIQDNKHIQKHNNLISGYNAVFDPDLMPLGLTDYETTLTIERDEFTPRFFIEKYTKRMVVRENGERALVDLYLPTQASQFGKVDAILIANLNRIWEEKNLKSDLTDFKTMWWYTDKAWGSDDVCLFKFDDIHFLGINVFDGSFVLTFDCHIVENGTDLTAKYRTKELDLKYENEEAKTDAVDMFALMRREQRRAEKKKEMDVNNMTNTTLKIS
jgi:hypothetical protein